MNPLQQLGACGEAVWLDNLKRSSIQTGELKTLIDNDGLKGGPPTPRSSRRPSLRAMNTGT